MSFTIRCLLLLVIVSPIAYCQNIISSDVTNFWKAYDACVRIQDTAKQRSILQTEFLDKASKGQQTVIQLKNYTPEEYLHAINNYRGFWESIRANYSKMPEIIASIRTDLQKLQSYYPTDLSNPIYLTVGLFRTGGTAFEQSVIIGTEVSFADAQTNVTDLPANLDYIKKHASTNPIQSVSLLCTHEYIHSLQKPIVHNLLSYCIYEGTAEYISCLATGNSSTTPAIQFGNINHENVISQFEQDMFIPKRVSNWLWSSAPNKFGIRDLGYYVGYALCDSFISNTPDKANAVSHLINLDLTDEAAVEYLVNSTGVLRLPLNRLYENFENSRPYVTNATPNTLVSNIAADSSITITITFSQPMDINQRGFDYGPLGEEHVLSVQEVVGFSADGTRFSYKTRVKPDKTYQVLITNNFCSTDGVPLKPFLYELTTK